MTTIELVRHGDAHGRGGWQGGADRERPLTDDGHRQAKGLARELAVAGPVHALYSSPFARCIQTLQPLADSLDVPVRRDDALAEAATVPVLDGGDAWVASAWLGGRTLAFLDRVVAAHAGGRVVACTHGDVVPAVMALLVGRDSLPLSDVRLAKGARFTLEFDDGRCVRAVPTAAPNG